MNPEELERLASEIGKALTDTVPNYSYLMWVFISFLMVLTPMLIKFIKSIKQMQNIMDLHIDELKYIRDEITRQDGKIDEIGKEFGKTKLQVMKNTTLIDVLKEKC